MRGYKFPLLFLSLIFVFILSLITGAAKITLPDLWAAIRAVMFGESDANQLQTIGIILNLRLPRALVTALIGAVLGLTGAALQGLFRNPLADPALVGVSAGATLFAAISILLAGYFVTIFSFVGIGLMMAIAAFLGALIASVIIYKLSSRYGHTDMSTMLLAGIAFNALAAAITGLIVYMADDSQMRSIAFWTMGSLAGTSWRELWIMLPFFVLSAIIILRRWKSLNAFSLGEREAKYLGENTNSLKREVLLASALGVGAAVAFCGIISFIGLIVPHLVRMTFTANHKLLLPGAALMGANILLLADLLCRTMAAPAEIPIGIITAIIGVPFFLWLIVRNHSRFNSAIA